MRWQLAQGASIVLLDGSGPIQLLDLTVRIDGNEYVSHIGLQKGITDLAICTGYSFGRLTHVNLVFVVTCFKIVQKCGLVQQHKLTCKLE